MKLSALLKPAIDAKMPHEAIMRMVLAFEAEHEAEVAAMSEADEQRKEKGRERWRRWKGNHPTNVGKRLPTTANDLRVGDAPVEDKTSNLDIEPVVKNKTRSDASGFEDALRALLDEDRLDALVKHRRSRKAPVTAYAADLFIAAAKACDISLAEATDHCIERNWLTVKPDWIAAKPPPRGSPSQRPPTAQEILKARRQEQPNHDDRPPIRPMLIASR